MLEVESRSPLVISVEMIEIDRMSVILWELDALNDLMFYVIRRLRVLCGAILRAAFRAAIHKLHFIGYPISIEVEKDPVVAGR